MFPISGSTIPLPLAVLASAVEHNPELPRVVKIEASLAQGLQSLSSPNKQSRSPHTRKAKGTKVSSAASTTVLPILLTSHLRRLGPTCKSQLALIFAGGTVNRVKSSLHNDSYSSRQLPNPE